VLEKNGILGIQILEKYCGAGAGMLSLAFKMKEKTGWE